MEKHNDNHYTLLNNAVNNIKTIDDCKEVFRLIKEHMGSYDEESAHGYADDVLLKAIAILGHEELIPMYWAASDHFWYA